MSTETERPSNVPKSAEWVAEDSEWVVGDKNGDGKWEGEIHYHRADGTLCAIATLVDGEPTGECRRFHPGGEISQIAHYINGELDGLRTWIGSDAPTPELMLAPGMSEDIKRVEVLYRAGRQIGRWMYVGDGAEVQADGTPMPPRPDGVPDGALYNGEGDFWIAGAWDAAGKKDGEMRLYRRDGSPLSIETYAADVLSGRYAELYEDGTVRIRCDHVDGERRGAFELYYRDGTLARRGEIAGGTWAGPLEDFDRDGQRIRRERIEPPAPPEAVDVPEGSTAALIAAGWGGDDNRDAARARAARAEIKKRCAADEALGSRLAAVGLDTAPRLITGERLDRLRDALGDCDAVDLDALDAAMAAEGGVGAMAALSAGGGRTLGFLRDRTHDDRLVLEWLGLRSLPVEVRYMPALVEIDASHNQLGDLPAEIGDVALLRRLKLNSNRIASLPAELARLRELASLHLASNGMSSIPAPLLELEQLFTLNLGDNQLAEIPDGFADLRRLDTLWLHGNSLLTLPASFARLESLTFLHLGDMPWSEPPPCLWELESLETLWIASRSLERLPADVARLPNLKELMVWYSGLTEVPEVLFEMTNLTELRITNNPLPDGTVDRLREALPGCAIY